MENSDYSKTVKTGANPEKYIQDIKSLNGLPTLPLIATEIQGVIKSNRLSIAQMVPIISKDPVFAMKLLKIANSAFYGVRKKIESVQQAMVMIGFAELYSLALVFSIAQTLKNDDFDPVSWKRFWEHCAATGHIADQLNKRLRIGLPNSAYSMGLLHDIGKLVLSILDKDQFADAQKLTQHGNYTTYEAEKKIYGISHLEAGSLISERWELPKAIQFSAGYHHRPSNIPDEKFLKMPALIQVADLFSHAIGMNFDSPPIEDIPEDLEGWKILQQENPGLESTTLKEVFDSLDDQMDAIKSTVSLLDM